VISTEIGTLASLGCTGRVVLLRLDLNSPIDPTSHQILDDKRFREHIPTIEALKKSRVVIITHQSRPGKKDFTTLEMHARKLEHLLHRPVTYVNDMVQCRGEPDPPGRGCRQDAYRQEPLRDGGLLR